MSEFTKQLEAALVKESLQDRVFAAMLTLGEEYEAKTITPERFAERIFRLLYDYATARAKIGEPSGDRDGS